MVSDVHKQKKVKEIIKEPPTSKKQLIRPVSTRKERKGMVSDVPKQKKAKEIIKEPPTLKNPFEPVSTRKERKGMVSDVPKQKKAKETPPTSKNPFQMTDPTCFYKKRKRRNGQ